MKTGSASVHNFWKYFTRDLVLNLSSCAFYFIDKLNPYATGVVQCVICVKSGTWIEEDFGFIVSCGVDLLTFDNQLLSAFTLRLSYKRSHEDLLNVGLDSAKPYNLDWSKPICFKNDVLSAIQSSKGISCNYPYQEKLQKLFCNSWTCETSKTNDHQ